MFDLDPVVDDRIDPDRGEARMAARIGIEGRDSHEAMHARFGLGPAMGVVALDQQRAGFDAGLFAGGLLDHLDLELLALGPAGVHAKQHARPVLTLGAAGARMNFDKGVVAVGFAREQRLDLAGLGFLQKRLERLDAFLFGRLVAGFLAEFDERQRVVELALEVFRPRPSALRAGCVRA